LVNIPSLYGYNREKSNESHRKKSNIIYNTYMPISYTLIRSKRKSLALQIDPSGKLIIRSPLRMDIGHIERFILDKIEWITKHQNKIQSLPKQEIKTEADIKILKEKIKNYIIPKVYEHWENKNLPKITSIKITKSEKRW
jgi:predicted metal-dependent hydrolase